MKKIFLPLIAITFGLASCKDCKDCTINTDVSVLVETFNPDTSSTETFSQQGVFSVPTTGTTNLEDQFFPIGYGEFCGSNLQDIDGKSETMTQSVGDSATTLYTYTWTAKYDCK